MRLGRSVLLVLIASALLHAESRSAPPDRFDANGVVLSYTVQGRGEPVLLIHGLYSSVRRNWELTGILQMLAVDHQVIALDLPGHGQSDKPDRADAYGVAMVDDVVLLLDRLAIKKVHVIGYSMGGMIAMKLMATHPERVASAVVGGMGWMQEGSLLAIFWERFQTAGRGQTPPVCVQSLGKLAISAADLAAIRIPTVVVVGADDPVKPLFVQPLETARPDWPVIEIPGANHTTAVQSPVFKQAITDALKKAPHIG
jgi:pimeloyl-ACP methyl ester carboxylesterase